jgi:hypothetical protein
MHEAVVTFRPGMKASAQAESSSSIEPCFGFSRSAGRVQQIWLCFERLEDRSGIGRVDLRIHRPEQKIRFGYRDTTERPLAVKFATGCSTHRPIRLRKNVLCARTKARKRGAAGRREASEEKQAQRLLQRRASGVELFRMARS